MNASSSHSPTPPVIMHPAPKPIKRKLRNPAEKDRLYRPIAAEVERAPNASRENSRKAVKAAKAPPIAAAPRAQKKARDTSENRKRLNSSSGSGGVISFAESERAVSKKKDPKSRVHFTDVSIKKGLRKNKDNILKKRRRFR